jgi:hypothetical protein
MAPDADTNGSGPFGRIPGRRRHDLVEDLQAGEFGDSSNPLGGEQSPADQDQRARDCVDRYQGLRFLASLPPRGGRNGHR